MTASRERLEGKRVVSAHRLSTIRQADRMYAMVDGRVVQEGKLADLTRQEGPFAQRMARQDGLDLIRSSTLLRCYALQRGHQL